MILVHLWDNCWDKWDKHINPLRMGLIVMYRG